MSIYKASKAILLEAVNKQNSLTVKDTDIVYSEPKDIRDTEQGTTADRNTLVKITGGFAGSNWSGKKNLFYDRLSLADLPSLIGDTIQMGTVETVHEALVGLNNRYGFVFETTDLANGPIFWEPDGQTGSVLLEAEPNSLGWVDTVTFQLVKGDESLTSAVTNVVLDGLKYPNGEMGSVTQSAIISEVYSYPFDYSEHRDTLLGIATGPLVTGDRINTVVDVLKKITGSAWVATAATSWGLLNAQITYNGLNTPAYPTNKKYKYVMIIQLPATTTNIKGKLYLQYNDPEDPNEV